MRLQPERKPQDRGRDGAVVMSTGGPGQRHTMKMAISLQELPFKPFPCQTL